MEREAVIVEREMRQRNAWAAHQRLLKQPQLSALHHYFVQTACNN